jgi:hypothetical protein
VARWEKQLAARVSEKYQSTKLTESSWKRIPFGYNGLGATPICFPNTAPQPFAFCECASIRSTCVRILEDILTSELRDVSNMASRSARARRTDLACR